MPIPVRKEQYVYPPQPAPVRPFPAKKRPRIVRKEPTLVNRIVSLVFFMSVGIFVLPTAFQKTTMSFWHGSQYPYVKTDYHNLRFPTSNYVSNHWFLGERSLRGARVKKPLMTPLHEQNRLTGLENQLQNLAKQYPGIEPAVYVFDFENGNYAGINQDKSFSAASIIKLPVLIDLFRSIEAGRFTIYDQMQLTDVYRAEGSGSLQFKGDSVYTIDDLARAMITESDNSSTNMLIAKLGSMTGVNHGIREWGLGKTYLQTWLPDLDGTNRTTAAELAAILYNIDNPDFLSVSSREKIFDYMGHVHNNRLIEAGLGAGAAFMHKTGDIGKMLGDAGIVFAPNGKRYIVVILANRPHNSPSGKEFIVKASEIIYNKMIN
ncbi:MAG: class A beta-lactamase-related serine hydrolase [Heliobacteriaceae bacterium]|jgi:beta-lactamase class A|nr:class A beta-lactamase-related serine hydrolase [Heliobacteriaceae bacterium]